MWGGVLAALALVGFWRLVSPGTGTLEADLSNLDGIEAHPIVKQT